MFMHLIVLGVRIGDLGRSRLDLNLQLARVEQVCRRRVHSCRRRDRQLLRTMKIGAVGLERFHRRRRALVVLGLMVIRRALAGRRIRIWGSELRCPAS